MNIHLRQEKPSDYSEVEALIEAAFKNEIYSDQSEHFLVARLRSSAAFIPELSILAESNGLVVGHIILTHINIVEESQRFPSLALAPVSVLPDYQKKGIGAQLIREAHRKAATLGHQSIVLLGHKDYYPRFGYELCSKYNIRLPFEAPEENCMVLALSEGGLDGVSGLVEYSSAFFE